MKEKVEGMTLDEALEKYEQMVFRFVNSAKTNHVCSREDLCQEGRMAIIIAFQTYDGSKGASFTTWVYHIIKGAILEYQKSHLSVLSGGTYLHNILRKAGEDATVEEIMEYGASKKTAQSVSYIKESYSTADITELESLIGSDASIPGNSFRINLEQYLTPTETYIVERFFGFDGSRMTMQEISEKIGKSRHSVAGTIRRAMVKLKHVPDIVEYLSTY